MRLHPEGRTDGSERTGEERYGLPSGGDAVAEGSDSMRGKIYDLCGSRISVLRGEDRREHFARIAQRYETGRPVADSLVRLDQEEAIAEDIKSGVPVLLRGHWRLGKTSMVRSLMKKHGADGDVIDIDMSMMGTKDDIETALQDLGRGEVVELLTEWEGLDALNADANEKHEEAIDASGMTPLQFLDARLGQRGQTLVLAIDELIAFADDMPRMQTVIEHLQSLKHVKPVVVLHRVHEYEEEFAKVFAGWKTHYIRSLTREEVATLVGKPLEGTGITFTPGAIDAMHRIAGGRPMEVQNICKALLDPTSDYALQKAEYTEEDVERIGDAEDPFRVALGTYEKIYARALGDAEREIVRKIIEQGPLPMESTDGETQRPLVDSLVIAVDPETGTYGINGALMERMFREKIEEERR